MLFRYFLCLALAGIGCAFGPGSVPALAAPSAVFANNLTQRVSEAAIKVGARNLSAADAQAFIEEEIEAAIVQGGAPPQDVLSALQALSVAGLPLGPGSQDAARKAIDAVAKRVAGLIQTSKEAGHPGAVAAPAGYPAFALPPFIAESGGGGGGSDYRLP